MENQQQAATQQEAAGAHPPATTSPATAHVAAAGRARGRSTDASPVSPEVASALFSSSMAAGAAPLTIGNAEAAAPQPTPLTADQISGGTCGWVALLVPVGGLGSGP